MLLNVTKKLATRLVAGCTAIAAVVLTGAASAQPTVSLGSGSNSGCDASEIAIPLNITGAENLSSFGVTVSYDSTQASYLGFEPGEALNGWAGAAANEAVLGTVIIGGFRGSAPQLNGDQLVGTLRFSCNPDACPSITTLNLTNATAGFNTATLVGGQLTCGEFPTLRIGDVAGACGTTIDVPLTIENYNTNVSSFGVTLTYNPAELDYVDTVAGAATTGWAGAAGNENVEGTVVLGGFRGSAPVATGDAELLIVRFNCVACPVTSPLILSTPSANVSTAVLANGSVECIDNQAPVASCVGQLTVNLSDGSILAAALNDGSSDPDGDDLTFTINDGINSGLASYELSCADVAASPITLTLEVSDGSLTDTCDVQVTVVDDIDPTVATQNITVDLDPTGAASITAAQVDNGSIDTCGTVSLSVAPSTFDCSDRGQNTVTLTVTDEAGNTATGTAIVTVRDVTPPNATASASVTLNLNAQGQATLTAQQINAQATDNCAGATVNISRTNFTCADVGAPVNITVGATDAAGNTDPTPVTVAVTVLDPIAPTAIAITETLEVSLDIYGNASITPAQIDNGSTDNCDTTPNLALDVTDFTCDDLGNQEVTLTVTDPSGNEATATATVVVVDEIAPTLTLGTTEISLALSAAGTATLTAGQVYGDGTSSTASDNCSVDVSSLQFSRSAFDCNDLGTPVVVDVTISDLSGNVSNTEQVTVTVVDNIAPTAVATDLTVELDASGVAAITAEQIDGGSSDNCGIASIAIDVDSFTCADIAAPVTVTLTVTDAAGNEATATATVTVVDNLDPVITAEPSVTVALDENGVATISAADLASATDNCDANPTVVIDVNSFNCDDVNTTIPVTVTATDASGNTDSVVVNVTVTDPTGACEVEEGEGEGIEEGCVDADGDGLVDDPSCLSIGIVEGSTNVGVAGGCLVETRQVLFENLDDTGVTTLVVPDPNNFEVTVTVTIDNSAIPAGQTAVLAVKVSCDLENLLAGDPSASVLESNLDADGVPVEEIIPGTFVLATVFQYDAGVVTEVQGVSATITYTGLEVNTVEEPTVYQHGTSVVNTGTVRVVGDVAGAWAESAETTRTGSTVEVTTNGLSVFVVTQPAPQVPFLAVRPNPDFTRVVGIVPVGQTRTVEFTLRNSGPGVVAGAATVTGAGFSIEGDATYTLAGATTDTIRVRFAPTVATPYAGTLTLTGGTNGPLEIALSGEGTTIGSGKTSNFLGCGASEGTGLGIGDMTIVGLLLAAMMAASRVWNRARA